MPRLKKSAPVPFRTVMFLGTTDGATLLTPEVPKCTTCNTKQVDYFLVLFTPERKEGYCMQCAFRAAQRLFGA